MGGAQGPSGGGGGAAGINECKTQNGGGCQHICADHYQGYYCLCRDGYQLLEDPNLRARCPQNSPNWWESNQYCLPLGNHGHICWCITVAQPYSVNGTQCVDLNECQINNGGCEDTCTNTQGS